VVLVGPGKIRGFRVSPQPKLRKITVPKSFSNWHHEIFSKARKYATKK
jgi:hypothetical protein